MRTAIIAAMEEEVIYLKQHISNYDMYEFQGYKYHIGEINDVPVVLAQSGIGKVNAALSTTILLEHFKVSKIINTGTAGAIKDEFKIGDIIIGDNCVFHDVDATCFGYKYGQVPQMPESFASDPAMIKVFSQIMTELSFDHLTGTIGTGDKFMTSIDECRSLLEKLPDIVAVDMEATAITQVCYQYQVPFVVVRSISDIVGQDNDIAFTKYVGIAAKNSTEVIINFLKI